MKNIKQESLTVQVGNNTVLHALGYARAERYIRKQFACSPVTAGVLYGVRIVTSDGRDITPKAKLDVSDSVISKLANLFTNS